MRYEDVVRADGPTGYWPLTDTTATATDGTTTPNLGSTGTAGTWNNTPNLAYVPGPGGTRAPYFSGTPYVAIPDDAAYSAAGGATALTVEAWFRPLAFPTVAMIISKGSGSNFEYQMTNTSAGLLDMTWLNSAGSVIGQHTTVDAAALGRWYHFVAVWDRPNSLARAFLNGRLFSSISESSSMSDTGSQVQIGRRQDGGGSLFVGNIAHCAIYQVALPASRVMAHYRAGTAVRRHR